MKIKCITLMMSAVLAWPSYAELNHFITRDGATLMEGNSEFRFAGIHSPELHRIEDDARGLCAADARGWGQYFKWPTADEQENWIKSMARVGQKATRIYVLSIEQQYDAACGRETHILAPLTPGGMPRFNEEAMVHYDRMIALADEHNVRLIVPFIDHWEWWGGRKQLAGFYGETEADFYDINSQTYAAYKYIIEQLITRTNTITGRKYYDEKAILAWETGNELRDTNEAFLNDVVAHIKSLDSNHLIQDGTYTKINSYALTNPDVDIISNHYYTNVGNNNPEQVVSDLQAINGEKVYLVGEFGLLSANQINAIMQSIVHSEHNGAKAAGGLVWGLRGHRHDGGFYWHREYTGHYSYHYPGFPEGDANQEQDVVNLVRDAQAQMNGLPYASPLPVPEAPKLRPITSSARINWMGAPVGRFYRVERAPSPTGPWQTVGENISDGKNQYDPTVDSLFSDTTGTAGSTYYYRVYASNESGESGPSNIQAASVPQATVFEAETATLSDGMFASDVNPGYTGSGYATGMISNAGRVTWTVQAEAAGIYDALITYAVDQTKENNLIVNGQSRPLNFPATGAYDNWQQQSLAIQLVEGVNQIAISGGWGYTDIDSLTVFGLTSQPQTNVAPNVTIHAPVTDGLTAQLTASVNDDGLPQGNTVSVNWTQISGPSGVSFSQPTATQTSVVASVAGSYSVRLQVSDGELTTERTLSFTLSEQVQNQPPSVTVTSGTHAGTAPVVGDTVQLMAYASDDGLPSNTLHYAWSLVSAPVGSAALVNDSSLATAWFNADIEGDYQFALQVDDGELSTQASLTVRVDVAACSGCNGGGLTNLALTGVASASSSDGYGGGASAVNDNNSATRWASEWSDNQWLTIDLLDVYAISSVRLFWESAYASEYDIETSLDGSTWSVVHTQLNGAGGEETIALTAQARFIKVQGIRRATQWGYSLWEVEVMGEHSDTPQPYLSVSPGSLSLPAATNNTEITLQTNENWVASSNQSWLAVLTGSGHGDGVVGVSAQANTGAARSAEVSIAAGGIQRTVQVSQAGVTAEPSHLEAEAAQLVNVTVVNTSGASGGQYVFMQGGGSLTWSIHADQSGPVDLVLGYRLPFGNKTQILVVNGVQQGSIEFNGEPNVWLEKTVQVDLQAGTNTVSIEKSWGWMQFDYLRKP